VPDSVTVSGASGCRLDVMFSERVGLTVIAMRLHQSGAKGFRAVDTLLSRTGHLLASSSGSTHVAYELLV
jgi:hypothetical protein